MKTKKATKVFPIKNCKDCPNSYLVPTPGTGYGQDRYCKAILVVDKQGKAVFDERGNRVFKKLAGYIEWPSEDCEDGVFPAKCPLKDGPKK